MKLYQKLVVAFLAMIGLVSLLIALFYFTKEVCREWKTTASANSVNQGSQNSSQGTPSIGPLPYVLVLADDKEAEITKVIRITTKTEDPLLTSSVTLAEVRLTNGFGNMELVPAYFMSPTNIFKIGNRVVVSPSFQQVGGGGGQWVYHIRPMPKG